MVKKTIRKDYFISFAEGSYIVTKNPINANLSINEAVNKPFERYLFEVGDKILTYFGVETIKEIINYDPEHHGYELIILVEENENQYKPVEIIGIVDESIKVK